MPVDDEFRSRPPRVSLERMIQRNRQLRQWFPGGLRDERERWEAKVGLEFHL